MKIYELPSRVSFVCAHYTNCSALNFLTRILLRYLTYYFRFHPSPHVGLPTDHVTSLLACMGVLPQDTIWQSRDIDLYKSMALRSFQDAVSIKPRKNNIAMHSSHPTFDYK